MKLIELLNKMDNNQRINIHSNWLNDDFEKNNNLIHLLHKIEYIDVFKACTCFNNLHKKEVSSIRVSEDTLYITLEK